MSTCQNPVATKLLPAEVRSSILGIGTCVAFAYQCIMQLLGGVFADIKWNYVFFAYLLLLLPLLFMVTSLPKIELEQPDTTKKEKEKFPKTAILLCCIMGIVGLNLAPLLFGSAVYVAPLNDSATAASIIAMMFSIGCMVGGLAFHQLYIKLQSKAISAFLIIGAIGLFISASAGNIILLGFGFFIGGISMACMQAGVMLFLGKACSFSQLGFASALMIALMNLGAFFCSTWESLIGKITGDALYAPLYVGSAIFVIVAAILLVTSPFEEKSRRG